MAPHSHRLSTEEAHRIVRIARRKSNEDTSKKDRDLRSLLGHAHIAETLKHQFLEPPTPVSRTRTAAVASHSEPKPQHIRWALPFAAEAAAEFDDDGEEDFGVLELVRTPSRSQERPPGR